MSSLSPRELAIRSARLARSRRYPVPFFRLLEHRRPTLWALYRPLLRLAPKADKDVVRRAFRRGRGLTSPATTKLRLEEAEGMLNALRSGTDEGRARWEAVVGAARDREGRKAARLGRLAEEKAARIATLPPPKATGKLLPPSLFNVPLPRLKPQPEHISMTIFRRRRARERRQEEEIDLQDSAADMDVEEGFRKRVGASMDGTASEWKRPIQTRLREIKQTFDCDHRRADMKYTPEDLARYAAIGKAVRRWANKMGRERNEKRRAEEAQKKAEEEVK